MFLVSLLLAQPVTSDNWHSASRGNCSDCHTQHNSALGQPMRYDNVADPALYLIRAADVEALCLTCHDGSRSSAPDVVQPVTYVPDPPAGMFPNRGGVATSMAHDFGMGVPVLPPGGTVPVVLSCTACHDPHGNGGYRNLRPDPTRSGKVPVTVVATQTNVPGGGQPIDTIYRPSNIVYKSGISQWCIRCHFEPVPGSDHPDDVQIWGSAVASYARWASTTYPRVPVDSPTDDAIPSNDDRVSCLSCHKAHGWTNQRMLIYADGVTLDATCQECHDQ